MVASPGRDAQPNPGADFTHSGATGAWTWCYFIEPTAEQSPRPGWLSLQEWRADSVRRKRKRAMNKHKHRKRRKLLRMRK